MVWFVAVAALTAGVAATLPSTLRHVAGCVPGPVPTHVRVLVIAGSVLTVPYAAALHTPLWVMVATVVVLAATVPAVVIDWYTFRLPDHYTLTALVGALLCLAAHYLSGGDGLGRALTGGALGYGLLLVFHLISPRAMGYGDVKFMAGLGLVVGWWSLWAIPVVVFTASAIAVVVHLVRTVRGIASRDVPFGPFLLAGTMTVLPFTDTIQQAVTL